MSRIFYLAKIVALIWMFSFPVSVWAGNGYVYDAAGPVYIAADKKVALRPAVKNDAVASGSVIRTGENGYAVLKFEDGQVVSMQSNSTFQVREYYYEPNQIENSNIVFSLFKGGMRFVTGLIGQHNPEAFRLATPNATIGIRGTDFLVVMANNSAYSRVLSGNITATNAAGMTILTAGQTGLTTSGTALTTLVPAASVPAGIFSEIAAIPVPPAVPAPVPPPASIVSAADTPAAAAGVTSATTSAGGIAAGGGAASAAATAGGAAAGISTATIGIGIGVAAVAAAVINSSTTQH